MVLCNERGVKTYLKSVTSNQLLYVNRARPHSDLDGKFLHISLAASVARLMISLCVLCCHDLALIDEEVGIGKLLFPHKGKQDPLNDISYWISRENSLGLIELFSINIKKALEFRFPVTNNGSHWTSRENSLGLIELSSIK